MYDIYCPTCDHIYIVGTASLTAFRNTDRGPVGQATCPVGHEVVVDFSTARAQRPIAA